MNNKPVPELPHNQRTVAQLEIVDGNGAIVVDKKYKLTEGPNTFRCVGTFMDGIKEPYKAIWTCPVLLRNGEFDTYGVLGDSPREEVTVYASANHTRYTELVCWAWSPAVRTPTGNTEIPHQSTGFDYSNISA